MKWKYILELSWKNLMNRKIRSVLTISGVIIGIASITFLISLAYGFEKMTTSKISSEQSFYVYDINLDNSDFTSINEEQANKVKEIQGVKELEPAITFGGNVVFNQVRSSVVINGYSKKYLDLNDLRLLRGNRFSDKDESKMIVSTAFLKSFEIPMNDFSKNKYDLEVLANASLSPSLNEGEIKQISAMEVVGVVDDDQSAYVILPYDYLKKYMSVSNFNLAKVKIDSKDREKISEIRAKTESLGLGTNYVGDTIQQINSFFLVFRYIVGGFGLIAMIVAILGMFNTLTVSLLERTREIGVLKSNGALKRDIWRIFLSEAIIISIIGGIFGILFGVVLGEITNGIFNNFALKNSAEAVDFFYTPVSFVIMTLIVNLFVGFVVGYYPAKRATRINALDALKYE